MLFRPWNVFCTFTLAFSAVRGRDISVGTATRYRLDGPRIESRWGGEIYRTRPDRLWDPLSLLYNGYRIFPGGKAAGTWRWPPNSSSAEVKERVDLYVYSTSGPSSPVLGWPLPLPFYLYLNSPQYVCSVKYGCFCSSLISCFPGMLLRQGRIKLLGASRQWKYFRPLFQA